MLSVGLIICTCRESPEAIRLAGAAWPTDICKCFGVITLFWWVEDRAVCIKVGYAKCSMEWVQNGNDYSPEFYHKDLGDDYTRATEKGCYTWLFHMCRTVPDTASPYVKSEDVRRGIAGIAETALRTCICYWLHHIKGISLLHFRYGSDMSPTKIFTGIWPSPGGGSGEFFVVTIDGSAQQNTIIEGINEAATFMDSLFTRWGDEYEDSESQLEAIQETTISWLSHAEVTECMAQSLYEKCMRVHDKIDCIAKPDSGCMS